MLYRDRQIMRWTHRKKKKKKKKHNTNQEKTRQANSVKVKINMMETGEVCLGGNPAH